MIETLHIENYALIKETDISFQSGFTAITGETGAGKSILLGALGLVLGQRADIHTLFDKQKKCIVEAQFNIENLGLDSFFNENDIDYDTHIILRREVLPTAKSRAFVNDTPVTLPILKTLASRLIDIHSQHETLTIANSEFQINLLDIFNNGNSIRKSYGQAYRNYTELKRRLEQLMDTDAQCKRDLDYNRFLYNELQNAKLSDGEQESLEQEAQLLEHTETIKQTLSSILNSCSQGDNAATPCLDSAKMQLSKIASFYPELDEFLSRMSSCLIELHDIFDGLENLDSNLLYTPERQDFVDDRLDTIYRLQKKHNVSTISELLAIEHHLNELIEAADNMDDEIRHAMEDVDTAYAKVQELAEQLTFARKKSATIIEKQILPTLAQLGMKEASLKVQITPAKEYGVLGGDSVEFLFNANRGGELRDIAKVASGGELSRLMLAIKSLISQATLLPTIIFDEIDTGVSGDIAVHVGSILHSMAEHMQVIAITHLPQIAATANDHFKVYKMVDCDDSSQKTASHIRQLSEKERVHEIAIMLSADPPSQSALETARELRSYMNKKNASN